ESKFAELAKLSLAAYEQVRKERARELGIRIGVLDSEVEKLRVPAPKTPHYESLAPPLPEPWPEPIDACALLDELHKFIERFVILDEHALNAVVLWIAFAHCFAVAETSPRLRITSPEKRCGKSRLLEILNVLCPRPLSASNISTSAIFRVIELEHCTLLI